MAQKTIPQLNPIIGDIDENSLFVMDSGTQTFKTTGKQVKNLFMHDSIFLQLLDSDRAKTAAFLRSKKKGAALGYDWESMGCVWYPFYSGMYFMVGRNIGNSNRSILYTRDPSMLPSLLKSVGTTLPALALTVGGHNGMAIAFCHSNKLHICSNDPLNPEDPRNPANWKELTPFSSESGNGLAWSPLLGLWVASTYNMFGGAIFTSTDGENFTERHRPGSISPGQVVWNDVLNMFFAVYPGASGTLGSYSYDGINWTDITGSFGGVVNRKLAFNSNNGMMVILGNDILMYSYDGIDWQPGVFNNDIYKKIEILDVIYIKELGCFVACGEPDPINLVSEANICYSYDGINWHYLNSYSGSYTETLKTLCWSPDLKQVLYGPLDEPNLFGT